MAITIKTTSSSKAVRKIVKSVPGIIAGREKDQFKLHSKFWGAVALSMFQSLHKAFDDKSQGLIDDLGNSWQDIAERTKAYSRPIHPGDIPRRMRLAEKKSNTIGLLSPNEYKLWKKIFGRVFHTNKEKLGVAEAKVLAGQIAWTELKKQGAQTKIDVLGSRKLLILRNTDRLYRSFLPGNLTAHSYRRFNRDQVFVVEKNAVTVGSRVEYASDAFEERPLWFGDISPWIKKASKAGIKRIIDYLEVILR